MVSGHWIPAVRVEMGSVKRKGKLVAKVVYQTVPTEFPKEPDGSVEWDIK